MKQGTMRRGTLRRNASNQSNRSSLTSLSVSGGRKVVEMPKAPSLPLRPKAKKDEDPKEKQSEVWQLTWL